MDTDTVSTNPAAHDRMVRDFPVPFGEVVTERHARLCREEGHKTWAIDGVDQDVCPRCGEVTRPAATNDRRATARPVLRELAEALEAKQHRGFRLVNVPFENVLEVRNRRHFVSVREDDGTLTLTVHTPDRAQLIEAEATFSHMPAVVVADVVEAYL